MKDSAHVFVRQRQKICLSSHVPLQQISSFLGIAPPISLDDSHFLIIARKGTDTCTQYPIANYVCYSSLCPNIKVFFTSLSSIPIPCSVLQALSQLSGKRQ